MTFDYVMATKSSCGPDELWTVARNAGYTNISREDIMAVWDFPNTGGIADDLRDSPGAHYRVMERLGITYRTVTLADILEGKCPDEKTAVLIHLGKDAASATLTQHWVIVSKVSIDAKRVVVQWGDATRRVFDFDQFTELYRRGGPTATAYVVGTTSIGTRTPWRWPAKAWDWIVSSVLGFLIGAGIFFGTR